MNLDELRPILHGYRAQVENAWSPATAHPGFEGKQGDPAGQCGVTSAWLQRRLLEDHGIGTTFCIGDVIPAVGIALRDHCWLELDTTEVDVVMDLTADQLRRLTSRGLPSLIARPVVCATLDDLFELGIDYAPLRHLTADELAADPVQVRLAILVEALS